MQGRLNIGVIFILINVIITTAPFFATRTTRVVAVGHVILRYLCDACDDKSKRETQWYCNNSEQELM